MRRNSAAPQFVGVLIRRYRDAVQARRLRWAHRIAGQAGLMFALIESGEETETVGFLSNLSTNEAIHRSRSKGDGKNDNISETSSRDPQVPVHANPRPDRAKLAQARCRATTRHRTRIPAPF